MLTFLCFNLLLVLNLLCSSLTYVRDSLLICFMGELSRLLISVGIVSHVCWHLKLRMMKTLQESLPHSENECKPRQMQSMLRRKKRLKENKIKLYGFLMQLQTEEREEKVRKSDG